MLLMPTSGALLSRLLSGSCQRIMAASPRAISAQWRGSSSAGRPMAMPCGQVPSVGELVALVDALRTGTLSESQRQVVQALRTGILALEVTGNCPTEGHLGRNTRHQEAMARSLSARDSS